MFGHCALTEWQWVGSERQVLAASVVRPNAVSPARRPVLSWWSSRAGGKAFDDTELEALRFLDLESGGADRRCGVVERDACRDRTLWA